MSGRVSDQISLYKTVEKKLANLPKCVNDWYFYLKANGLSATTCKEYVNKISSYYQYICDNSNDKDLLNVNTNLVVDYFLTINTPNNSYKRGIVSDSYKQTIWSCLNNFYTYMVSCGSIQQNPLVSSQLKRPKNKDLQRINKDRVLLSKDDFKKILDKVESGFGNGKMLAYQKRFKNRDKSIMLIFMTTGIRKTALREIDVDDINMDTGELTVIDKGYTTQNYILDEKTIECIKMWLIDRYFILGGKKEKALFVSRNRERLSGNSIAEMVDKYAYAALGYHISPHKLRSGLASIVYKETKDIEYVRRVIGHSNITTTQRYIVTDNKERERTANMVSSMIL